MHLANYPEVIISYLAHLTAHNCLTEIDFKASPLLVMSYRHGTVINLFRILAGQVENLITLQSV